MLVKPVNKVVFAELNLMSAFYSKTFAISCLNTSGYPHLTCTLSPEGSPLGQDPEVSGWVWCGSASDAGPWAAGPVVLETGSEGAWRERQQVELKGALEKGGLWAEEVSASVGHLQGRQRSPWALELQMHCKYATKKLLSQKFIKYNSDSCWGFPDSMQSLNLNCLLVVTVDNFHNLLTFRPRFRWPIGGLSLQAWRNTRGSWRRHVWTDHSWNIQTIVME